MCYKDKGGQAGPHVLPAWLALQTGIRSYSGVCNKKTKEHNQEHTV